MISSNPYNKQLLENLILTSFIKFGNISSAKLLNSLKNLGYYYATQGGISLSFQDFLLSHIKTCLQNTLHDHEKNINIKIIENKYDLIESYEATLDLWNEITNLLKVKIIDYYQNYTPLNNLFIMCTSGARGNLAQLVQLLGFRGLMSDADGNIIDVPVVNSFYSGLSLLDYIICSYGSRKGVVDTALKTADSGYLTRRLVYVLHDLILTEVDCQTQNGILIFSYNNTLLKQFIGRTLVLIKIKNKLIYYNKPLTYKLFFYLRNLKNNITILKFRSSLTCTIYNNICQTCYGWELNNFRKITIGSNIGVIAAQAIGEPGTQLTMRTFHTGGTYENFEIELIRAPETGKLILPKYSTFSNNILTSSKSTIYLITWSGKILALKCPKNMTYDYPLISYINKNDIIGYYPVITTSNFTDILEDNTLKDNNDINYLTEKDFEKLDKKELELKLSYFSILTPMSGKITYYNTYSYIYNLKYKFIYNKSYFWLKAGRIITIPNNCKYNSFTKLFNYKPFAYLNLITPYSGILFITLNTLEFKTKLKNYKINLQYFQNIFLKLNLQLNCFYKLLFFSKNYQFFDAYSLLGYLTIYTKYTGSLYFASKKKYTLFSKLYLVTELDTYKVYSDINISPIYQLTSNIYNTYIKKEGLTYIYQYLFPVILPNNTLINFYNSDFFEENCCIGVLAHKSNAAADIVQGLPKLEDLLNGVKSYNTAKLVSNPSILLYTPDTNLVITYKYINNILIYIYKSLPTSRYQNEIIKLYFFSNIFYFKNLLYFNNKLYLGYLVLNPYKFIGIQKLKFIKFSKLSIKFYKILNNTLYTYLKFNPNSFYIKQLKNNIFFYNLTTKKFFVLKYFINIQSNTIHSSNMLLYTSGQFLDLGEPYTFGGISLEKLLLTFYYYHIKFNGYYKGLKISLLKFNIIFLNTFLGIYDAQNIFVHYTYFEILIKYLISYGEIFYCGNTNFYYMELIDLKYIYELFKVYNSSFKKYLCPLIIPRNFSILTINSLKSGFLTISSYQNTRFLLVDKTLRGVTDWITGLKEHLITGQLLHTGSTYLEPILSLNHLYNFKKF
uniref:DNA-directed RNA polymerase n=1 Tax=Spumella sp. NIES-1846 TaxID=2490549 RepID=A0A455RFR9_9STRA|nr:RNA polymerase b''-subunit [Spumella sp. NIES-1846]